MGWSGELHVSYKARLVLIDPIHCAADFYALERRVSYDLIYQHAQRCLRPMTCRNDVWGDDEGAPDDGENAQLSKGTI